MKKIILGLVGAFLISPLFAAGNNDASMGSSGGANGQMDSGAGMNTGTGTGTGTDNPNMNTDSSTSGSGAGTDAGSK